MMGKIKKKFFTRYRKTLIQFLLYKFSKSYQTHIPIYIFLIASLLAFLTFYISIPYNQSKFLIQVVGSFTDSIGIDNFNDKTIKTALKTILSSLTLVISLLSAIYVFTHREQKNVSPSASTDNAKNKLVSIGACLIIFNIFYGGLIVHEYTRLLALPEYTTSLEITKQLFSKLFLIFYTLIFLLIYLVLLIVYLFETMSADKMLNNSVSQTSRLFLTILHMDRSEKFNPMLEEKYKKFHFSLESVFQNLKFAAEHNMNKEFEVNIDNFNQQVISSLKEKIEEYDINDVPTYLYKQDGIEFVNVYKSMLRSTLSLIASLLKNQQYNKAKEVVNLYFDMYVDSNDTLNKIFKISINELIDIINPEDERQLLIFIEGIKKLPAEDTLIYYKFLMMKIINRNQVKILTNLVYVFKDNNNESLVKPSVVIILLQCLIKSVEISHYQISGFLVKFLISNFSGKEINRRLKVLKINSDSFTKITELAENEEDKVVGITEDGSYPIKINEETFKYCYRKAFILLYAQQIYTIKNKLWYTEKWAEKGMELQLKEELSKCTYSKYLLTKVKAASKSYGLLLFEDKDVIKKIYDELNIPYPESNAVKEEVTLSDAITFVMDRLFTSKTKAKV